MNSINPYKPSDLENLTPEQANEYCYDHGTVVFFGINVDRMVVFSFWLCILVAVPAYVSAYIDPVHKVTEQAAIALAVAGGFHALSVGVYLLNQFWTMRNEV